ncbi:16S rRNA (guanine(527)-N(7))-methyltransferase RsmG [[Mycoplasma] phocae]|uniref:Ribosomal RNA small subunit methyltransferase G n=1 Tax=[Mycoplasma] phocae TaxID=142651 RepID=A0A2Z5IPV5_9BACT|nr:16S rRNA (guanine(527)-N(7))-methyltransferase RsmG [[Mycoplasma] phocae]AXE60512.1 16S rRNA (guanine(527)-N(7))-methyltransferase RsmG [[Mycoplasma] phocae]
MLTAVKTHSLFKSYLKSGNDKTFSQLHQYYELIEEENKNYNLTGFYDEKLIQEGIVESILIFDKINSEIFAFENKAVLDIGSGAGFPIIPYFIYNPQFELTIFEPQQKRVNFLNLVIKKLNLKNIKVENIRAENSLANEKFDFISARAVSELKNLVEISHHLGKLNSTFCFLKSKNYLAEINNAKWITSKLNINFQILKLNKFFEIDNVLVYYKKVNKTPQDIPRNWSQIIKDNLTKIQKN